MARSCQLTGKSVQTGNKVSHSNRKSRRRFLPNLHAVTLKSDALGKEIALRVATRTLRSVDHNGGLDQFLVTAKAHNLSIFGANLRRKIKKALAVAK